MRIATLYRVLQIVAIAGAFLGPSGIIAWASCAANDSSGYFNLDIVGDTYPAGTDNPSRKFSRSTEFANFREAFRGDLSTAFDSADANVVTLDPSRLYLHTAHEARAYFIGQGSSYHNSFGFTVTEPGSEARRSLIFPDTRSGTAVGGQSPLGEGDFVDMGRLGRNSKLDFFLIADGARGGTSVFSTEDSVNPDGVREMMARAYAYENSPYILLAFDDGSDSEMDYNELVVALHLGTKNVANIIQTVGAPEPATMASLATFFAIGVGARRRRRWQEQESE